MERRHDGHRGAVDEGIDRRVNLHPWPGRVSAHQQGPDGPHRHLRDKVLEVSEAERGSARGERSSGAAAPCAEVRVSKNDPHPVRSLVLAPGVMRGCWTWDRGRSGT